MNEPLYTPEEFADAMRFLRMNISDEEECHMSMDNCMCQLLIGLGYEEGVEIFWDTTKYYG